MLKRTSSNGRSGSHSPKPSFFSLSLRCLTADTVIDFVAGGSYVYDTCGLRFKNESYQTLNRLTGNDPSTEVYRNVPRKIFASQSGTYASPSTGFCTLDLRGTASAVTYLVLCDAVNVVWNPVDDFVQDFRNGRHVTSGTITVKRGTVRTSGSLRSPG